MAVYDLEEQETIDDLKAWWTSREEGERAWRWDFAGELAAGHRVKALDARGHVAIGDALHFKLVQIAVIGNLAERQRGVFNQPDGGCFRHQRGIGHNFFAPSEPSGVP